jgi:two-component system, cell cycle sensor histidine kinase and response regulator CckA
MQMTDRILKVLGRSNGLPLGWRLAISVLLVLAAVAAHLSLSARIASQLPMITFIPAVAIAAMMGGVASGALATLLSAGFLSYVLRSFGSIDYVEGLMAFFVASAVVVGMAGLLHSGRARLDAADAAQRGALMKAAFIRQAPVAIAMFDRDMRYIAVSRKWLSDYGLGDRDLVGLHHYDIFPEISEEWRSANRRALDGETTRVEEDPFQLADGREVWLRWEVRPWRHEEADVGGVIIWSEDITRRKQAEAEIVRSEALFRAMFENANIGMAQSGPDARWLRVNARLCEIIGYSAEELTASPYIRVVHPDDAQAVVNLGERILAGELDNYATEKRFVRKDGSIAWVSLYVKGIMGADGKIQHKVTVVEDISDRKRFEAELRENQLRLSADLDAMTRLQALGALSVQGDDPQPILNKVVETAQAIAKADFGTIQMAEAPNNRLRIVAQRGFSDEWLEFWNKHPELGAGPFAALQRRRVIVEDVETNPIFVNTPAAAVQRNASVRAVISTPLVTRSGRLVGIFSVHYRTPKRPDESTLRLLDLLGQHAADIIDQMQTAAQLRANEARYRAIVDSSAASFVTTDEEGVIQTANPATFTIFGYEPEELVGLNAAILMPDARAALHDEYIDHYKRTGVAKVIGAGRDVVARRKDGAAVDIELAIAEWRDAAGKRFFTGSMRDIGTRKQAEAALRKFSRVVEQTASAVVITDTEGFIEYVNPRFTEISGYSADEVIGRKPGILKSGHTSHDEYRMLWNTITEGGVWRGEFRNRRRDGSLYWLAATISPIRDPSGRITNFAGVTEDITARKELESQLAAAQRMEAIGRLAGSIAHDFNNLLAVIAGNLELISHRSADPAILKLVRPALEATGSGAAVTRRLLSLTAKRQVAPVAFSPNDRIREMRSMFERGVGSAISWEYRLADDLWPIVADPGELDSALLNLLTNSRDAMPAGGQIVLETRNVTLDASGAANLSHGARAGDYVHISVTDDGLGMNKEILERAFEPFFTTKVGGKGTGLGLSGVKTFIDRAGGFATIESREGDGTTISLYLPRTQAEAARPGKSENVPLGDGEVVLVVDDDDDVREVTLRRVEALGYVVEPARSGAEAIEILQSGLHPDVVLSDIVMHGGMSGVELARWIRTEAPNVRVALVTGFSGGLEVGDTVALDAPVLQKPFTRMQLARTLAQALAQRPYSDVTSAANT